MPSGPWRTTKVPAWLEEEVSKGRSSELTHRQNGEWLPERALLHDQIVEELSRAQAVPREGAALLVGGLPGVGKSTLVAQLYLGDTPRYLLVDMDEIVLAMSRRGLIPEVRDETQGREAVRLTPWEAAQLVRPEAVHLWYQLMELGVARPDQSGHRRHDEDHRACHRAHRDAPAGRLYAL